MIETDEKPEECDCCGYETTALEFFDLPPRRPQWLCALCSGSFASTAVDYPHHFHDGGMTVKTICYVANVILDAIRKGQALR